VEGDYDTIRHPFNCRDVDGGQLGSAKCAGKADQQQGPVAHVLGGLAERRNNGRQLLCRKGRYTPLRAAVGAA